MTKESRGPQDRGPSSTSDILGSAPARKKVPSKWAEHHRLLSELKDRLSGNKQLQSLSAKQQVSVFSQHMADAATDSYDRDWALALASSTQSALYEIDEALNRIANGTYGTCEITGKPIERERLEAIPWTRFSATVQAEVEAGGGVTRPHLGELGTYANEDIDELSEDAEDSSPEGDKAAA
jgi:RNA polymerase-binding transcription factor DksA